MPTIIATGVASPNAHGQEITKTEIAKFNAYEKFFEITNQTINVIIEIATTVGTNTPETLSARRAIGALLFPESSISWIIFSSMVSAPTFSALNLKNPLMAIEALVT